MSSVDRASGAVAHVVSELRPGGVELRTYELLHYLQPLSMRHVVFTMSGRKGSLAERYEDLSVNVRALKLRSVGFPFRFWSALRRNRVTVVHSYIHYSSGYLLMLAWLAGVPTRICHFRSDGWTARGRLHAFQLSIMRLLIDKFATAIVGVSPGALEGSWSPDWRSDPRCAVVQNGLDLEAFATAEPADLDEVGILPIDRPVLVHVGRADLPTKNREKAIRVLAALRVHLPSAVLLFVGRDGRDDVQAAENRRKWARLAKQYGVERNVHYAGERDDVKNILAAADCFLLTSTLEGLPGVLLEAMAVGITVVSTALPGAKYIQEVVGGVVLIDEQENDKEWARQIAASLRERGARRGREATVNRLLGTAFDLKVSSQGYVRLWQA